MFLRKSNIKSKIFRWIDSILSEELPDNVSAFNFNLYEGDGTFHIQIIGARCFAEEDEDWACDEVFTTGENIFVIPRKVTGQNWKEGLTYTIELIKDYLVTGNNSGILKSTDAVGVGFVDGDIEIVYRKSKT